MGKPLRCLSITCAVTLAAADAAAQSGVQTLTVSGTPTCGNCEIALERVFTVVDKGDSASIQQNRAPVRDSRGRFFFLSAGGMNGIVVFDSTGKLLARFGRAGQGPGEFGGISTIMLMGQGDTLFVCGARQCQLFSPEFKYVRAIPTVPGSVTMGAVIMSNGDLALQMRSSDSAPSRSPVHRMSTLGRLVRSFGATTPIDRNCTLCVANSGLGVSHNREEVWIAPAGRYELELWSGDGQPRRRFLIQNSPWYTQWNPNDRSATPMSRIYKIVEDPGGVLLVFGTEAERLNEPIALPPGVKISASEAARLRVPVRWTPRIEALDMATGAVLASRRAPGIAVSTFGGEFVTTVRESSGPTQYVDVWRVRFRRQ